MSNFKNIFIGLFISICLLFSSHLTLYGNGIKFRNSNEEIPIETTEMNADNITVLMSKNSIYAVTMTFNSHIEHPDAVILMNKADVPCKIVKMYENKVLIDFPKSWVKSLRIDFSGEGLSSGEQRYNQRSNERFNEVDENERRGNYNNHRLRRREDFADNDYVERDRYRNTNQRTSERYIDNMEGVRRSNRNNDFGKASYYDDDDYADSDVLDIIMLEDELEEKHAEPDRSGRVARSDVKNWLLSEIRDAKSGKKSNSRQSSRNQLQSEEFDLLDETLRNDIRAEKENQLTENNERVQFRNNAGRVKGRFLYSGNPLASCKVRLVKLRKVGLVYYKDTETGETMPIEVSTDRRGVFDFDNTKPGFYKLYWKPPTESSWIRRVSMEPDVIVTAGKVANLDDIETNQRILN
ncbi:MAG: hypothetical protein ACUZ8E_10030 [Candidatus Anammoxibacter sp.]